MELQLDSFQMSALDANRFLTPRSGRTFAGEKKKGCVGPRAGGGSDKIPAPVENRSPVVQRVISNFTVCSLFDTDATDIELPCQCWRFWKLSRVVG